MTRKVYSPKEFAAWLAENDITRSADWVRDQCALYIRTKGRRGIAVVLNSRPYLIPASECARFQRPCVFSARAVCVA